MTSNGDEAIQSVKDALAYLNEAKDKLTKHPEEINNPELIQGLNKLDKQVKTLLDEAQNNE